MNTHKYLDEQLAKARRIYLEEQIEGAAFTRIPVPYAAA